MLWIKFDVVNQKGEWWLKKEQECCEIYMNFEYKEISSWSNNKHYTENIYMQINRYIFCSTSFSLVQFYLLYYIYRVVLCSNCHNWNKNNKHIKKKMEQSFFLQDQS